jgi:magnesium-transporting ATPase (P-type)
VPQAPLVLIFTLSACKEGFDDMHRRKADQAANQRPVQVLREGSFRIVPSHNVRVGELVLVTQDDEFCADMVLLSASFRADQSAPTVDSVGDRFCFIETSNIDGESNLKHRSAVLETAQHSVRQLTAMQARVICDQPNHHIYSFDARLEMQGATLPLTNDQLLLQGTFLRHTHWVIGLVVYTGDETKVGMNKQSTLIQTKTVPLDTRIDQGIVLIFLLQTVCVVIWGLLGYQWQSTAGSLHWYLGLSGTPSAKQCLILVLRFLLLCSMMIPISIKVASDLLKLAYSLFISWDLEFYDESRVRAFLF